jgi:hypothetical protein
MDCFVASLLAMTKRERDSTFSRQHLPEFCNFAALEVRGRRECRMLAAPMARLQK